LIENNRKLIIFLKLMDIHENCGDPWGCDGGRILPEAGNGDGEYFRWQDKEW
jgi:hypothetical protein